MLTLKDFEDRRPANRKKKRDGKFVTMGVNWVWSLDGHDKLMGFQNYSKLRIDRGTETGLLATLHVFLRRNHRDMTPEDTVEYELIIYQQQN